MKPVVKVVLHLIAFCFFYQYLSSKEKLFLYLDWLIIPKLYLHLHQLFAEDNRLRNIERWFAR